MAMAMAIQKFKIGPARTTGKFYAEILKIDARGDYPLIGFVRHRTGDQEASWTAGGQLNKGKTSVFDLLPQTSNEVDCDDE